MEEVVPRLLEIARPISPDDLLLKRDIPSRFWKGVFEQARDLGASDIHVECGRESLVVRCRVGGELRPVRSLQDDGPQVKALIIRLKMICRLDVSVDDEAQDQSISFDLTRSRYRVALSPTVFGENFVFRVIRDEDIPQLSNLFLPSQTEAHLRESMSQKQGLIVVTGPTGSGKSTTLQSILMELDREKKKVITIENPVERILPGVMQKEISPKVSWEVAIKMALREDPDIILIGEIRDAVSAQLALQAAQTGHLVFSTLHTNDVAGIVDRLIGLGVDQKMVAENLIFAMAQRLVQRLCAGCKVPTAKGNFRRCFEGCGRCRQKVPGAWGRVPIVEYSFRPDPLSLLSFDRKAFVRDQLHASLFQECQRLVGEGEVDEGELSYW